MGKRGGIVNSKKAWTKENTRNGQLVENVLIVGGTIAAKASTHQPKKCREKGVARKGGTPPFARSQ